jgi:DNA polymerase I-like protein with 3'-5' exonuclease and polymerase domains
MAEWKKVRGRAQRQALNTPIQGTSADITKLALALFNEAQTSGKLIACVHDEVVVEAADLDAFVVADALRAAMKQACDTPLPPRSRSQSACLDH